MLKMLKVLLVLGCVCLARCDDPKMPTEPKGEKISFSAPDMSDEEQHSTHLPQGFNCDACTAITYQMDLALSKAENSKGGKRLKESDYLDVFEILCSGKTWENYGLKTVNGVNRLSGKGLEAEDVAGMMYGGGKWPGRLSSKCFSIIGDVGEDDLYDVYREKLSLKKFLCTEYSKDCVKGNKKKAKKEL